MARSLDQIEKDLKALADNTAALDEKLQGLYSQYLPVLGAAVRQQFILAAYHLCTQTHPEAFLALSKAERESLQAALRKLGKQGQSRIEALVNMDNVSATLSLLLQSQDGGFSQEAIAAVLEAPDSPEATTAPVSAEAEAEASESSSPSEQAPAAESPAPHGPDPAIADAAPPPHPADGAGVADDRGVEDGTDVEDVPDGADIADPDESHTLRALPPQALAAIAAALSSSQPPEAPSPLHLAKRHVLLERQIRAILHTLSNMGNYLLKRAKILPDLPEAVLSAAAESDPGEGTAATPNLLSVIVEVGQRLQADDNENDEDDEGEDDAPDLSDPLEDEDDAPERAMTHLVALNLRLGDIEFTDAQTALRRSKIQETLARLKQLSSRYQRLQQEKARAAAEATWRSTWFDEDN